MTQAAPRSSAAPPLAVEVTQLTYRYPDGRLALDGVSFHIQPGEIVALVGSNGAGKSTLLQHLNGLLPERRRATLHTHGAADERASAAGLVRIEGTPVTDRTAPDIRRRVGLLFQDPDDQLFSASVLDDVAFGPLNQGLSRNEARSLALDCLARVGMAEAADRPPHHLSFGERKRVCLAGVLACRPTILALDEPTANLDPRNRRRFLELMRSVDATRIIATHDLEMVLDLCDRVILLDSGRVVTEGPPRALLADEPLLEAHGLELPTSIRVRRECNEPLGLTSPSPETRPRD